MVHRYTVPTGPYFDLAACLASGQIFRFWQLPDSRWAFAVGSSGFVCSVDDGTVKVVSNAPQSDFVALFQLEFDAAQVEEKFVGAFPNHANLLQAHRGVRVLRSPCLAETVCSFICSSNNNVKRIQGMVSDLANKGEPFEVDGVPFRSFPGLDVLSRIALEDLQAAKFGYRSAWIPAAARMLHLDWHSMPTADARKEFMALPGIGGKVADCILLFGLGRGEVVPIDVHMGRQLARLFGEGLKPAELQRKMSEHFGEHAGWVQQWLFAAALARQ